MQTPLVSICCITYNHTLYIRQCLDGFVMQKTNFPVEILIHDDASTDGTADIIREYEQKYPDIIKPIYQIENQYSKSIDPFSTYIFPRIYNSLNGNGRSRRLLYRSRKFRNRFNQYFFFIPFGKRIVQLA